MTSIDFTVSVDYHGVQRDVDVIVYDTVKGLRIAASRYDNEGCSRGEKRRGQFSDTLGVCHRFELQNPEGETHPLCAIVRLAKPHVGVGVITHEMAHAAVWIREMEDPGEQLLSANDEEFCWILGDLVRQTVNGMNEHGAFDSEEE